MAPYVCVFLKRNRLPVWIEHQALKESANCTFHSVHRFRRTKPSMSISCTWKQSCFFSFSPRGENIEFLRNSVKTFHLTKPILRRELSHLVVNKFWLLLRFFFSTETSEDEKSDVGRAVCVCVCVWCRWRRDDARPSWVGADEGAEECRCQLDPRGKLNEEQGGRVIRGRGSQPS